MGVLRVDLSIEQPLLTVIMPIYNGESNLAPAIESILNATYQNIELLLIDDGSLDNSGKICAKYREKDRRIKYIRQKNAGIVSARNAGLAEASGDYVCFCDQDDLVAPLMYERLIKKMHPCEAQIGICATGRLIGQNKSPYEKIVDGVYEGEEIRKQLLYPILFRGYDYPFAQSDNYLYGTLWKCIYNRSFIDNNGFCLRRFIDYEDDWIFVTQTLCAAKKVVTDSRIGYYWRVSDGSNSHDCHFVEDIIRKMREFDAYVMQYLETAVVDKDLLKAYIKVSLCEHFVILYQNETGIEQYDKAKRRRYRAEVRQYMESENYKSVLQCRKHLKKGMLRRRVVLWAMKYLGIERTFCISKALDWTERTLSNVRWIVMLERRLKG